jgi:hypothetical protein
MSVHTCCPPSCNDPSPDTPWSSCIALPMPPRTLPRQLRIRRRLNMAFFPSFRRTPGSPCRCRQASSTFPHELCSAPPPCTGSTVRSRHLSQPRSCHRERHSGLPVRRGSKPYIQHPYPRRTRCSCSYMRRPLCRGVTRRNRYRGPRRRSHRSADSGPSAGSPRGSCSAPRCRARIDPLRVRRHHPSSTADCSCTGRLVSQRRSLRSWCNDRTACTDDCPCSPRRLPRHNARPFLGSDRHTSTAS